MVGQAQDGRPIRELAGDSEGSVLMNPCRDHTNSSHECLLDLFVNSTTIAGGEMVTGDIDPITDGVYRIKPLEVPKLEAFLDHYRKIASCLDGLLEHAVEEPLTNADDINFQPFRDFIPVIKLTRVFVNKLSRPTNNGPHPLSQMSIDTLSALYRATLFIPEHVDYVIGSMEYDYGKYSHINPATVYGILECFERVFKIMVKYFRHQGTNLTSVQGSNQRFDEWYDVWYSHLLLATNRFTKMHPLAMSDYLQKAPNFSTITN
ncbi:hypothetical protein PSTG_10143 [Puccinia striiformis f. sp. tritici PST-78]|uniref:Uncharacterized protein n=1 Tax=Puccinia striiformis f. sp. tritici PST-78 TaxID=1165861 RepID=A0A0L0VC82_9BASI|nr:hypothetical protein PSTG_10143 [Puccinia striiformis f. sp. tritici PST-78]